MNSKSEWKLEKNSCHSIANADFSIHFDPTRPNLGAHLRDQRKNSVAAELFVLEQIGFDPLRKIQSYVRDNDSISWYAGTKTCPLEVLIMLRYCPDYNGQEVERGLCWFELLLSLQTSLLDASPISQLSCRFLGVDLSSCRLTSPDIAKSTKTLNVFGEQQVPNVVSCRNTQRAIVFAVHPTDLSAIHMHTVKNDVLCTADLQVRNLEKGVIRRLRFFAGIGNENQLDALLKLVHQFEDSQLPLSN